MHRGLFSESAVLFPGSADSNAANILAEGLRIREVARNGRRLGNGIYGAPSPLKAFSYTSGSDRLILVCRFNLKGSKHSNTGSSGLDEFCIFDDRRVVVLWLLKVRTRVAKV